MLLIRSFLAKIKRWPDLCWASKKEKKGGRREEEKPNHPNTAKCPLEAKITSG